MAWEEYGFLLHRSVRTLKQYSEVLKIVPGVLMAERGYNVPGVLLTERGYNVTIFLLVLVLTELLRRQPSASVTEVKAPPCSAGVIRSYRKHT